MESRMGGGGGQIIMSHGIQNSKGVAVLIQKNSRVRVNKITIHEDGHYVLVSLKVNDITMLLVNVYGPNMDEPQFFDEIIEKIKQYDEANVMFMGDFNLALNSLLDRADGGNYSPKATEKLHIIMDELGLLDAWRVLNPEGKRFSWHRQQSASRIDYVLLDHSIMNQIKYIDYKPGYKTDHSFLEFSFNVATEQRGRGYWKFNARLLHDKDFVEQVNYILDNVEASQLNPHEKWDALKEKIQTVAIKRAKVIAHKNRENFDNLTKQVLECEWSVDIDHRNVTKYIEYLNAKVQLEQLVQQQTNAAKFRSKCNTALAFERSSKYFFALGNNYNKKVMSQNQEFRRKNYLQRK